MSSYDFSILTCKFRSPITTCILTSKNKFTIFCQYLLLVSCLSKQHHHYDRHCQLSSEICSFFTGSCLPPHFPLTLQPGVVIWPSSHQWSMNICSMGCCQVYLLTFPLPLFQLLADKVDNGLRRHKKKMADPPNWIPEGLYEAVTT